MASGEDGGSAFVEGGVSGVIVGVKIVGVVVEWRDRGDVGCGDVRCCFVHQNNNRKRKTAN